MVDVYSNLHNIVVFVVFIPPLFNSGYICRNRGACSCYGNKGTCIFFFNNNAGCSGSKLTNLSL